MRSVPRWLRLPGSAVQAVLWLGLTATVSAQTAPPVTRDGEAADRIVRTDGKELVARVARRLDPDGPVLVLDDGKRLRIPRPRIRSMDCVRDRMARLLALRRRAPRSLSAQWTLIEWAEQNALPDAARLLAIEYLLDPDLAAGASALPSAAADGDASDEDAATRRLRERFARAHEIAGARRAGDRWLWKHRSEWLPLAQWLERSADWGRELRLRSEHFVVRTSGGPVRAIHALFDLEFLLAEMFSELGADLRFAEPIRRIEFRIWDTAEDFPPRSTARIPYFVPHPFGDAGLTYYLPDGNSPVDLVTLGVQAVLYRCLVGDAALATEYDRFAASMEIGLGQWYQARALGAPGRLAFGPHPRDDVHIDLSLRAREAYGIEDVIQFGLRVHFYNPLSRRHDLYWADAHMLVAFLMAHPDLRRGFLGFLRTALGDSKGTSSSLFDDALGRKIETLREPWVAWLRSL